MGHNLIAWVRIGSGISPYLLRQVLEIRRARLVGGIGKEKTKVAHYGFQFAGTIGTCTTSKIKKKLPTLVRRRECCRRESQVSRHNRSEFCKAPVGPLA